MTNLLKQIIQELGSLIQTRISDYKKFKLHQLGEKYYLLKKFGKRTVGPTLSGSINADSSASLPQLCLLLVLEVQYDPFHLPSL